MEVILVILAIAYFVLMFYSMRKDKSIAGFYSSIGVCGRWRAFFTMYLLSMGVASVIAIPVNLALKMASVTECIAFAVVAAVSFALGLLMYRKIYEKCPASLKKRLLWDMFIIFFGVVSRIALFFLMFIFAMWWAMNRPTAYEVDGKTVYAYPGSDTLYDEYGHEVGRANSDRTRAIMD